jgi:hypothetical protein
MNSFNEKARGLEGWTGQAGQLKDPTPWAAPRGKQEFPVLLQQKGGADTCTLLSFPEETMCSSWVWMACGDHRRSVDSCQMLTEHLGW